MTSTTRRDIRVAQYRVLVLETFGGRFSVEVHEEQGRDWELVQGPFRCESLERAELMAGELAESLRFDA